MRRNEGRVVNTPLVFKRVLFERTKKVGKRTERETRRRRERTEGERRERTDGRREERESGGERERNPPCMEKRAESGNWSEKGMNAGGVENGNMN
ncbi:hypothetical protein TNCV_1954521 [Trichonephila clavipes]|nr:hypothetical protein TNCV_1954521 [Trichonephila clavipes]